MGVDEILLPRAGPAELDARLRLLVGRHAAGSEPKRPDTIILGELIIEEQTFTVTLQSHPVQLTFKEFELLKYLAQHPGQVFTASNCSNLSGATTFSAVHGVDVHIRGLRAKLGVENATLIGTVRNVGYKATQPARGQSPAGRSAGSELSHQRPVDAISTPDETPGAPGQDTTASAAAAPDPAMPNREPRSSSRCSQQMTRGAYDSSQHPHPGNCAAFEMPQTHSCPTLRRQRRRIRSSTNHHECGEVTALVPAMTYLVGVVASGDECDIAFWIECEVRRSLQRGVTSQAAKQPVASTVSP